MDHFNYRDGTLFAEDVSVAEIAASVGTPVYIYSAATFRRHFEVFDEALAGMDHLICYAVKANSNLAVLNLLARLGAGFDIVSVGELEGAPEGRRLPPTRRFARGGRPSARGLDPHLPCVSRGGWPVGRSSSGAGFAPA